MTADYLVLGIISAIVAHNMDAVRDMLQVLALQDPERAGEVQAAIARGLKAHKGGAE